MYGGIPCQLVAPNGAQRALEDERSPVTTSALPRIVNMTGALVADAENSNHIAIVNNGEVLLELDAQMTRIGMVRTPRIDGNPCGAEILSPTSVGGPVSRPRWFGHWERLKLVLALGECPPLMPQRLPRILIRHIMCAFEDIPPANFAVGRVLEVPRAVSIDRPTVAAELWYGSETDPLITGSRVRPIRGADGTIAAPLREVTYVVMGKYGTQCSLFYDAPGSKEHHHCVEQSALEHVLHCQIVLDVNSIALSFTRMGVPQVGPAKQLWLRNGRAVIPTPSELRRVLELTPRCDDYIGGPHAYDLVGNGVSMRAAEAVAARTSVRLRRYKNYLALTEYESHGCDGSPEYELAKVFDAYPTLPKRVYVIALASDGVSLEALVGADAVSLPSPAAVDTVTTNKPRRTAALLAAASLISAAFEAPSPCVILVHDGDDGIIVAAPVMRGQMCPDAAAFAKWVRLRELTASPLYVPVSAAMAHVASYMNNKVDYNPTRIRGARPLRPLASAAYAPPLRPAIWPAQLQYAEATDSSLRSALLARPDKSSLDR